MRIYVTVNDAQGQPIPGAHLLRLDASGNWTGAGTTTDVFGMASLDPGVYRIRHIGYVQQDVPLHFDQDVTLERAVYVLDEVVIRPDRPPGTDNGATADGVTAGHVAAGAGALLLLLLFFNND